MIIVSANHSSADWTLVNQPFAVVESGEFGAYRVGGDSANGYYAIAPKFGCGRNANSPESAIRNLVLSNGCTSFTAQTGV